MNKLRSFFLFIQFFSPALGTLWGLLLVPNFVSAEIHAFTPPAEDTELSKLNKLDLFKQMEILPDDCAQFHRNSSEYKAKFVAPMLKWVGSKNKLLNVEKVLYPFSGVDIVTATSLFPNAKHFILVADQWPEYKRNIKTYTAQVAAECKIIGFFMRYGYYRTNDLEGKGSGATPPRINKLISYNIALSGYKLVNSEFIVLGANGKIKIFQNVEGVRPDGLRLNTVNTKGDPVKIDYVRINLSNDGIGKNRKYASFLRSEMKDAVFVKSGSHLLQSPSFSTLGSLIKSEARLIAQDETGLDIDAMAAYFDITTYGNFTVPHSIWRHSESANRLRSYLQKKEKSEPLPFTLGYEKKSGSVLLVGDRKFKKVKITPIESLSSKQ